MSKTAEAFRTISEVAGELDVPKHVLRFWEGRFPQIRPMKRGGGRRYYRPEDLALLRGICRLLHAEGYTIKGVQKILREQGVDQVKRMGVDGEEKEPQTAPMAAKQRGRPPKALATHAGALPRDVLPLGGSALPMPPGARGGPSPILAAIAELEVCRSILLGKAIETSARRRGVKARRPARS
jgi:DNA-binding transcriptional MerR regulator